MNQNYKIKKLTIDQLQGRELIYHSLIKSNHQLVVIYGHHSVLERWLGMAEAFASFGQVNMPDLPGFGGMTSFYKIHKRPSLDNYAEYLHKYLLANFKNKKVTLVGLSFGFIVLTRLLQNYPEHQKDINLLISVVGFSHANEFRFSPVRRYFYIFGSQVLAYRPMAKLYSLIFVKSGLMRYIYQYSYNAKSKFTNLTKAQLTLAIAMEMRLWQVNDMPTHMYTSHDFFSLDNTQVKIPLTIWHVSVKADIYFNAQQIRVNLAKIFKTVNFYLEDSPTHAPTVIADAQEFLKLIPKPIIKQLQAQAKI